MQADPLNVCLPANTQAPTDQPSATMIVPTIFGGLPPIESGDDAGSEVMQRVAAPMLGGMLSAAVAVHVDHLRGVSDARRLALRNRPDRPGGDRRVLSFHRAPRASCRRAAAPVAAGLSMHGRLAIAEETEMCRQIGAACEAYAGKKPRVVHSSCLTAKM